MSYASATYQHNPVMTDQVEQFLGLKTGEVFCDCTLGGAGHSILLGKRLGQDGFLIGIDRDQYALAAARKRLSSELPDIRQVVMHGNFADLDKLLLSLAIPGVDAFLFDLGTSSHQLDTQSRGFSYSQDGPLDMRMDAENTTLTAETIINTFSESDLASIIQTYGEERFAYRIAKAIVRKRDTEPYTLTSQLAETVRGAVPAAARRSGGNPAKRTFQALRIYINSELQAVEQGLEAALRWLNPGGRVVVLSYHSLEDRIVKQSFAQAAQACICPPDVTICVCGRQQRFDLLTKKPETPEQDEIQANPRSASAKLRAITKRI
ncbi:MAG: 16S rRNA (cytosine(1402)-N(4))-methyltransferase RsmH [Coriobacteriia bacterium]|nr:16S rRNA (cytosine(1402)-N(4))-methyltransferase RsmH [Coriobacteriia bacterium]